MFRELTSSTLQNWIKRGWVENAPLKRYTVDQVAHILIINMLRSCVQLDHIAFLLHYINGRVDDRSDDIIRDSVLYDYISKILDRLIEEDNCSGASIRGVIREVTADYAESARAHMSASTTRWRLSLRRTMPLFSSGTRTIC